MARRKFASPTLELEITPEQHEEAVESQSGGCLIADAVKKQYPHLSAVRVDMATIRATDKKAGVRYVYLTSPEAQHLLLSFDQGWPQATEHLTIRKAVQVIPLMRGKALTRERAERLTALEEKIDRGEELTKPEKAALTNLRKHPERPTSRGPVQVKGKGEAVIHGGPPRVQGPPHPNLLRGRDRHFGAKLADPGRAFQEAVDAAVAQKLEAQQELSA